MATVTLAWGTTSRILPRLQSPFIKQRKKGVWVESASYTWTASEHARSPFGASTFRVQHSQRFSILCSQLVASLLNSKQKNKGVWKSSFVCLKAPLLTKLKFACGNDIPTQQSRAIPLSSRPSPLRGSGLDTAVWPSSLLRNVYVHVVYSSSTPLNLLSPRSRSRDRPSR